MATRRQLEANRLNALKSTGPRTPEGKARSRRNAITHGLTARDVVLAHEDPARFEALCEELRLRFKPRDAFEEELAGRIAALLWRLRRFPVFEAALLDKISLESGLGNDAFYFGALSARQAQELSLVDFEYKSNQPDEMRCLARAVETFLRNDLTSKLSSYEVRLQRQLQLTLKELNELPSSRTFDAGPQADEIEA